MMSVTSSRTPGSVVNSCATPSILTAVTAAPSSDEEQDAAQRVPEGVAEAAVERLDHEDAAVLVGVLADDPRDLEVHQLVRVAKTILSLLRVELDDERFLDRRVDLLALRHFKTLPVRPSWSACSQGATLAVRSVASR